MASNVLEPASQPSLSSNPVQCTVYPCNAMQCNTSQRSLSSNPVQPNPCNAIQFNADCIHAMHTSQPNATQCNTMHCISMQYTVLQLLSSYHPTHNPMHSTNPRIPNAFPMQQKHPMCNVTATTALKCRELAQIGCNWFNRRSGQKL